MAYTEISAQTVLEACDAFISDHNERINTEREELIQKHMKGFFGRIKDREKVIKQLKNGDVFSPWYEINVSGYYWYSKVVELKNLAIVAKKHHKNINLDVESASLLKDYL